jgi:hypothetical protein
MLSMNKYPKEYVARCRSRVKRQVAAYQSLQAALGPGKAAAASSFEPVFFENMLLALESAFTHRSRTLEGKDGNPLNEVRVLAQSILEHDGRLHPDKSIKLDPDNSVLKLKPGDPVALDAADFTRLAEAFFREIERKFA